MSSTSFTTSFSLAEQDPLKKVRQKCWERFLEVGVPDSKSDTYQFVKLREILNSTFTKANTAEPAPESLVILPECQNSCVVFVNGYFRSDLCRVPKGVQLLSMQQAFKSYSALMNNRFSKFAKEESDAFCLLNAAHFQDGAFLYIPPKLKLDSPIQILNIVDEAKECSWVMPRLHCFVSQSAELTIASTCEMVRGERVLYNACLDFEIEENAKVHFSHVDLGKTPLHSFRFDAFRGTVKRDALLTGVVMSDSERSRRDFHVQLNGSGSDCQLSGVWFLEGKQETHSNVCIEHIAPHTQSMQLFKGVLEESSISSFQGKIKVHKIAQKTQAYQLNNNLVLSAKAQANSKPNLEIFADDVKASHGATVGQLNEEQLFYLKTRGLSDMLSKSLLIFGFCDEVLARIPVASLCALAEERLRAFSMRLPNA